MKTQETNSRRQLYVVEAKHGATTYSFKKDNILETRKFLGKLSKEGFVDVIVYKIKRLMSFK